MGTLIGTAIDRCPEKFVLEPLDASPRLLWCSSTEGHTDPHRALVDASLLFPESTEPYVTFWWENTPVA